MLGLLLIRVFALVMACVIALYKKSVLYLGKLQCFAHYETLLFIIAAVKAFFKGTMCMRY